MTLQVEAGRLASLIRSARVGELLPPETVEFGLARRLDATAFVLPDAAGLDAYLAGLDVARDDLAAWDGRVIALEPGGEAQHRVAIVDRYGQVYETIDAPEADGLPDARALEEWFKFLATACPECGVLDDPRERDWVP